MSLVVNLYVDYKLFSIVCLIFPCLFFIHGGAHIPIKYTKLLVLLLCRHIQQGFAVPQFLEQVLKHRVAKLQLLGLVFVVYGELATKCLTQLNFLFLITPTILRSECQCGLQYVNEDSYIIESLLCLTMLLILCGYLCFFD